MLQLKNICKNYKTGNLIQKALDNVSLNFRDNEFVSILGPSGSGKSTLLNIVGGLDQYDNGDLIIDGVSTKKYKDADWDSYRNHAIGFIFQSYNLIGHQTILSNVELALTISGISNNKRKKLALDALEKVGLKDQAHKKPNQLSGGQMQRVAIARALVNNPSILLADEPTGALDTVTSVQVMELLKEVAKDRLVVMVTHNPELAKNYSTRIVELKDGKIITDNNPFEIDNKEEAIHKNFGKASMSFLTSIGLSFNNLKTKFKRTLMVAFAGSIGIIGIGLILGLSNGVNKFIKDTEEKTMLSYPIQILNSSFSMASMIGGSEISERVNAEGDIGELKTLEGLLSAVSRNDLSSLKQYFENEGNEIYDYSKALEYNYGIEPNIYVLEDDEYVLVNPNESFSSLGLSSTNIMFSNSSINVFNKLPKNDILYKDKYELRYGCWPQNKNECIVVTDSEGNLSDFIFYSLGLRDNDELEKIIDDFANEINTTWTADVRNWKYDDVVGRSFKVLSSSKYYTYDEKNNIYVDSSNDKAYLKNMLEQSGIDLKVVGIASPIDEDDSLTLRTGVWYTEDLIDTLRQVAFESEVVQAQMANPNTNILTNGPFGEDSKDEFDFKSMFSIDESKLTSAFKIDQSKVNIDPSSLTNMDFSKYSMPSDYSSMLSPDLLNNINIKVDDEKLKELITNLANGYMKYSSTDISTDYAKLPEAMTEYIITDEGRNLLSQQLIKIMQKNQGTLISEEMFISIITEIMNGYQEYALQHNYLDPSRFNEYLNEYLNSDEAKAIINAQTQILVDHMIKNMNIDQNDVMELATALNAGYTEYAKKNNKPDPSKFEESLKSYFSTEEAKNMLYAGVIASINSEEIKAQLLQIGEGMSGAIAAQMSSVMQDIVTDLSNNIKVMILNAVSSFPKAISIDVEKFTSAFMINTSEEEMQSFIMALMNNAKTSFDSNLKAFGYLDEDNVSEIDVYPKDFDSKKLAMTFIDDYNEKMEASGDTDKMVTYTDLIGIMLSSVTTIINVISYVLIAFVAISLVVSSIMIGVITYISVLERKKEIGILRAIGASKRNISQVFNAETGIIGTFAGLLGVGITVTLFFPANMIIRHVTNIPTLTAYISIPQGLVLLSISIVLTLIGGLIPSKSAAKQNPVEALRTD